MNTLPKFSEQYDKIIQAYFKDEIKLNDSCFCFCGTLNDNTKFRWKEGSDKYSAAEYTRMEVAVFSHIENSDFKYFNDDASMYILAPEKINEDELFSGMAAALEVLKQIHIEHGEVIEETPVFTKRELSLQKINQ